MHYHGTPITPRKALLSLAGRHFCVSHARPDDCRVVHEIGQSVMLDNGAFSVWRRGHLPDWESYYRWTEEWLRYWTTWAVIPDVIEGNEEEQDSLIRQWPHGDRGAPVWHLHESIERLERLSSIWPRVCIGSSAQYAQVGSPGWHRRMIEAMNRLCGDGPPPTRLHMLRGMSLAGSHYPFASLDSTDIAANHHCKQNEAQKMAQRWDGLQCKPTWRRQAEQCELLTG